MRDTASRAGAPRPGPVRWLFLEFTKLRLAVWLLIIMGVTMVVGSVFPQGYGAETYIESWGEAKYTVLSKWGLLNLFHTKFFIVLGVILLLNLVACSVVRWFGRSGARLSAGEAPAQARAIALPQGADPARRAADVLTSQGYKVLSLSESVVTARRGPWPEGVSLLYHLAMALAIVGFILSALFAFEGDVTLAPGEPASVATVSAKTGANALAKNLAAWSIGDWRPFARMPADTTAWADRKVTLVLSEFITEWELYQGKYYNRDWVSDLEVRHAPPGRDVTAARALIEVNKPLRVGGLTFYQTAFDQWFDVVVRKDGVEVERAGAQAYVPFTLESVGGMFFPGALRVGTLFERYREPRPVVPHSPLKWQPADAPEDAKPEEIGDLSAGGPLERDGFTLTLENPRESSILSYRHDPGVPLLYIAIVAFIAGLAIRTYWPSYRVNLWIERGAAGAPGRLLFRATGMLGEPEEVEAELAGKLEAGG